PRAYPQRANGSHCASGYTRNGPRHSRFLARETASNQNFPEGSSLMISFSGINLLAVLSAGVITFFLGAVWYMPLFGKLWMKLHGYSEEKVKKMQARLAPAVFF